MCVKHDMQLHTSVTTITHLKEMFIRNIVQKNTHLYISPISNVVWHPTLWRRAWPQIKPTEYIRNCKDK